MDTLPIPLTPEDCNLQDFQYMPLDVLRLRDSDLAARVTGEEFRCAVLLWCASWHQTPAASLPDDDINLAQYAGFGRAIDQWLVHKPGSMRGWIKCADGRLYHPVVAEKANEAWLAKHKLAYEKLSERIRKRNKARAEKGQSPLEIPTLEHWLDMGRPLEKSLFPLEFSSPSAVKHDFSAGTGDEFLRNSGEIPPENSLKGEERKGTEGNGLFKTSGSNDGSGTAHARDESASMSPSQISIALIGWERDRNKAARGISASNQQVIDLSELDITPDELRKAYDGAVADRLATSDPNPVNAGFVRTFVEKNRRPKPVREDNAWKRSPAGIERKASELGINAPAGKDHDWLREKCESVMRQRAQGVAA